MRISKFTYTFFLLLISVSVFSKKLKEGTYRAVLFINETTKLPFNFDVKYEKKKPRIIIRNADEKIVVDEITIKGDSVNFKMPVFDTEFRTKLIGDTLQGVWINHYRTSNNIMRFKAVFGESRRFLFSSAQSNPVFEGKWETIFSPNTNDSSKAIAVFHHQEQTDFVTGTFLTETGDYRYLEGMKHENKLYLSCFDGSHAYLFVVEYQNGELVNGKFYSGIHWQENWTAKRNDNFKLANAEEITLVKNKNEALNFSFLNTEGKPISLNDQRYQNKAVIVQIMGSWCPNCMDESRYFAEVYRQYKNQGLEIIALAFEKTTDFEKAKTQVQRMKKRLNVEYEVLITQQTGKQQASETLSLLNNISAFPTAIFLNKQHLITTVHTGFSGPATGNEYELFKQHTETLIKNLLK
ncbi:MAG: TlpA family protein disulfide reductase [Bacteroidetes bacterium]|nr:TlpA family protein disulfide reductase [Bacteroidota bacterium]